jgi:CRP-like cAMP-binding protein
LAPSLVCTLTTETVERMIDGNPRVTLEMLRLLSKRLRAAEIRLTEPVYKQVIARLASLILRLSASEGIMGWNGVRIDPPLHPPATRDDDQCR